jgi:DHA2 family multidrug resistance protein
LIGLNDEITRQAQIIAYANDFKLMLLVSVPVALLIFLMRRPGRRPAIAAAPVE